MPNVLLKVFMGLAVTSIVLFGADNWSGTWKQNFAKSEQTPPLKNPYKSSILIWESSDGGTKGTGTSEGQDGTTHNWGWTAKSGKEYAVAFTGLPWDTGSGKQVDANTRTFEIWKTGGKFRATGRWVLSEDGKTLTSTYRGVDGQGQPFSVKAVFEKQ